MSHFGTQNMNFMRFVGDTRTKVHFFMRQRRVFLRARKIFRMAVMRLTPAFPDRRKYISMYSSEELATMFHFPIRISGMTVGSLGKVDSKKVSPPPNLPVGE